MKGKERNAFPKLSSRAKIQNILSTCLNMWDDDTGNIYVDDDDNVDDDTLFYKHKLQMLTSGVKE